MRWASILFIFLCAPIARAEVPRVAVDIAPLHSLVAQVMEGVGTPDLIMRPGASPHHYAMRPSEAAALAEADLVFWLGPELTPWLDGAINDLAGSARHIALLHQAQSVLLPFRESVAFEHDDHDNHDDHDDHEAHDDGHGGHDHEGGIDPHAWLDPDNAIVWLGAIAAEIAFKDPDNATLYVANMKRAARRIALRSEEISEDLDTREIAPFLVLHDAYQYFESKFGIRSAAAVSLGDASQPGPARMAALKALVRERDITCVLTEPQSDPKLARAILPEHHKTGVLDLLGVELPPGPDLYVDMLRSLADGFAACSR